MGVRMRLVSSSVRHCPCCVTQKSGRSCFAAGSLHPRRRRSRDTSELQRRHVPWVASIPFSRSGARALSDVCTPSSRKALPKEASERRTCKEKALLACKPIGARRPARGSLGDVLLRPLCGRAQPPGDGPAAPAGAGGRGISDGRTTVPAVADAATTGPSAGSHATEAAAGLTGGRWASVISGQESTRMAIAESR